MAKLKKRSKKDLRKRARYRRRTFWLLEVMRNREEEKLQSCFIKEQ